MLIERQKRMSRVRFRHPIRVVTLEGQPRVIRTLTANVSHKGLFLRMPEPLPLGTKVALSLEAGGRALALAQAEVVWGRHNESQLPGRFPGCGVRFTEFMHPRAQELVKYLVENLDRGKPLVLAGPERPWARWLPAAGASALLACAAIAGLLLWAPSEPPKHEDAQPAIVELAAAPAAPPAEVAVAPPPGLAAEALPPEAAVPVEEAPAVGDAVAQVEGLPPVAQPAAAAVTTVPFDEQPAVVAVAQVKTPSTQQRDPSVAAVAVVAPAPVTAAAPEPSPSRPALADTRGAAGRSPVVVAAAARPPSEPNAPGSETRKGTLKLPSGAATGLTWTVVGDELRLVPELSGHGAVRRAFVLAGPSRAVFDLSGSAPSRSHVVAASVPRAAGVRLGKLPGGTRVVIDLDRAPKRVSTDGAALVLSF